jgi:two-component sensor histidine kinase
MNVTTLCTVWCRQSRGSSLDRKLGGNFYAGLAVKHSHRTRALRLLQIGSIVLPMFLLIGWGVWSWVTERAETVEKAQTNVELVHQYADRVIQSQWSLLNEVGDLLGEADLSDVDLEELHLRLARWVARSDFTLSLGIVSPEGDLLVSSLRFPFATRVDDREYFQALRDGGAGEPYIERVTLRPGDREALLVAMRRPGVEFTGILTAAIAVEAFTDFFGRITKDERASASLMRSDGMLLVRHRPEEPATLLPANSAAMQAVSRGDRGVFNALAITDGIERIYAFARVRDLPIFAHFGAPRAAIFEAWLRDMTVIGSLLALAAILGLVGTTQAARRIDAEQARQHADFDRRLLEEARKTAELRGTLLREVHHRTKNNLQNIHSLIKLNGSSPVKNLEERIWAITQVHDLLYNARNFQSVDLGEFLETLCTNPSIVPPERGIAVQCDVQKVEVGIDAAVPLALAAVELVTNAVKHAFPDGRSGAIGVKLRHSDGQAHLVISDDGIGISNGTTRRNSGLRLVRGFVTQVKGTLEVNGGHGTSYSVQFPLTPMSEIAYGDKAGHDLPDLEIGSPHQCRCTDSG